VLLLGRAGLGHQPVRVNAWNDLLRSEAARNRGKITLLNLNQVVCPDGKFI
jgi:hypothetical protein